MGEWKEPAVKMSGHDAMLGVEVGMCTHRGPTRDLNEDLAGYRVPGSGDAQAARGALFVVADGMGGHQAGEVASWTAVETVIREYYADTEPQPGERLVRAVKAANREIYEHSRLNAAQSGMGTTLVAAVLTGWRVYVANVGDSRAYLWAAEGASRPVTLSQITVDHSWVAEQAEIGLLTAEEMAAHPQRNLITRALGTHPSVIVDLFTGDLMAGDRLLLCTDGVCGAVPAGTMAQILGTLAPAEAAQELVAQAARHGGHDNATALVVHTAAASPAARPAGGEAKADDDSTNAQTEVSLLPAAGQVGLWVRARELAMAGRRGRERWGARVWWAAAAVAVVALVCLLATTAWLMTRTRTTGVAPEPAPIHESGLSSLSEAEWAEYLGYASVDEMQARYGSGVVRERWPARPFMLLVGKAGDWQCVAGEQCIFTLKVADRQYRIECPAPESDARPEGEQVRVLAQVVDPRSHSLAAVLVERDQDSRRRGQDWQPIAGHMADGGPIWVYCMVADLGKLVDEDGEGQPEGAGRALVYGTWSGEGLAQIDRYYVYQEGAYRLRGAAGSPPMPTATLIPTGAPGK